MDDFTLDGLPDLRQSLQRLDARARELEGEHHVPVRDLFPAGFMRRHTPYESLGEMVEASGLDANTSDDLTGDPAWDRFVAGHSSFDGWDSMVETAARAWAYRRLGFH